MVRRSCVAHIVKVGSSLTSSIVAFSDMPFGNTMGCLLIHTPRRKSCVLYLNKTRYGGVVNPLFTRDLGPSQRSVRINRRLLLSLVRRVASPRSLLRLSNKKVSKCLKRDVFEGSSHVFVDTKKGRRWTWTGAKWFLLDSRSRRRLLFGSSFTLAPLKTIHTINPTTGSAPNVRTEMDTPFVTDSPCKLMTASYKDNATKTMANNVMPDALFELCAELSQWRDTSELFGRRPVAHELHQSTHTSPNRTRVTGFHVRSC